MAELAADLTSTKIVLLQALVRGYLVRRKLLEVRKEFEDVLNDLEKNSNFVSWKTTTLGLPSISSDPKVLHRVDKEKISRTKENDDEVKQRDSLKDEFSVKEFETVLNTEHSEQSNGERSAVDEEPVQERPGSGASNSESFNSHSDLLQINQESGQENSSTFRQVHSLGEQAICSREQASERKRLLIPKSDTTAQCDCPDERCPHRVPDLPFPLNSTLKSAPGSGPEREEIQSVGRESTSESSLQSYLQGRTPHLRDQARLSDTWLTDRSFDTIPGEDSSKGLPTDPVKLRELREHIGMELLWTEQAIQSRKKYLGLRKGLAEAQKEDPTINWE